MNFLQALKYTGKAARQIYASYKQQSIDDLDRWMDSSLGGGGTSISGANVTGETALNFTAYFSGVLQISQSIGSCECEIYNKIGDGKEPAYFNPVYNLLTKKANPYMNSFVFKEILQNHAISWGNGYALIVRDNSYRPKALWPLYPDRMKVELKDNGEPEYVYRSPKTNREVKYDWNDVFHLAGFGFNGLTGYSMIGLHREAIGLGLAQQEFTERFISNGVNISGILKHPKLLSEKAQKNLKASFKKQYSGLANVGNFPVLEEGMSFEPLSMPLEDAQFLESKLFQVQEMARILNIPNYKLKDYSDATYSNVAELQIEYITDTIRPWAERWEAAIDTQLLGRDAQKGARTTFAQFDLNQLIRGDAKTQAEAARIYRYAGAYNADEIRAQRGDNPIADPKVGKTYWKPVNMEDAAQPAVKEKNNENTEIEK